MESKQDQESENRPETSVSRKRNDQKLVEYCKQRNQFEQKYLKDNNDQSQKQDRSTQQDFKKSNGFADQKKFLIKSSTNFYKGSQKNLKCGEDWRYVPKNIIIDQEQQYQEIIKLKQLINYLKQENDNLRTRCYKYDEELQKSKQVIMKNKLDKSLISSEVELNYMNANTLRQQGINTIKNMGGQYANRITNAADDSNLSKQLRKQITELKQIIEQKSNEITQLKKTCTVTKNNELMIENKAFQDENIRLKQIIENTKSINKKLAKLDIDDKTSNQVDILNQQITVLKEDNIKMALNLKNIEEQLFLLKMSYKEQQIENSNLQGEKKKHKKNIIELEKEVQKFKGNDPFLNQQKRSQYSNPNDQNLKNQLEKKDEEIAGLKMNSTMREKKYFETEKRYLEQKLEMEEKLKQEVKEKQSLQTKLEKDQVTIQELREEIQNLSILRNKLVASADRKQTFISQDKHASLTKIESITNIEQKFLNLQNKKLPIVTKNDVLHIGLTIKLQLLTQNIPLEEMDKYLVSQENLVSNVITINEITQRISQKPFLVDGEDNQLLIARYLVETNSENYIVFNFDQEQDVNTVRSTLKQLIGKYELLPESQQAKLHNGVSEMLQKQRPNIEDYLNKEVLKNNVNQVIEFCKLQDFETILKSLEVAIKQKELDYILMKLWSTTTNVNKVNLQKFYLYFSKDSQ